MITSINNRKVYRIVTRYLQVYPLYASLPVICKFTRYMQVYPLYASLPVTRVTAKFARKTKITSLPERFLAICSIRRTVSLQFVIDSPLLHFEYLTFTE